MAKEASKNNESKANKERQPKTNNPFAFRACLCSRAALMFVFVPVFVFVFCCLCFSFTHTHREHSMLHAPRLSGLSALHSLFVCLLGCCHHSRNMLSSKVICYNKRPGTDSAACKQQHQQWQQQWQQVRQATVRQFVLKNSLTRSSCCTHTLLHATFL